MPQQTARDADRSVPDDIAIVGMDCVFPGAPNLQAFWDNIVNKRDAISDPPPEWDAELYFDPASGDNDRLYTKRGGFLGELCAFDPLKHGVVPSTVDGGEPDQFLALEIASRALADADFAKRPVAGDRVEIVLGRGTSINRGISTLMHHGMFVDRLLKILHTLHPEHTDDELARIKAELKASLPPFNGEMAAALIPTLASGRIANRLDFKGANYLIDAACASSHIATQKGVEDLRAGRCDVALVGGCQASTAAPNFMVFTQLSALSRRGDIRPFDKDADGTLMGEGVGILVLKRLPDAEAAGDRIYAVIKAIGVASDGRGVGILAPRVEGEVLALTRAYDESGVAPQTIELVEAHGTGTPLGDATEIASLKTMFGERNPSLPPIAVGAVKSMIGHCLPAAGAAGLIKTALALHTKILPPTLHCDTPNPDFGLEQSPLYINTETRPWVHGAPWPRRAGVNAFGFGGINAHAILEEYRGHGESAFPLRRPSEVLIVEAETREALVARAGEAAAAVAAGTDRPLAEHARAFNTALRGLPLRVAVVAASHQDGVAKLADAAGRLGDANRSRIRDRRGLYFAAEPMAAKAKLAFMFPGEGSQYQNMLRELCLYFPEVRAWFDRIDRAFAGHARGLLPSQVIFPPPRSGANSDKPDMAGLWRMDVGPEAIFTASQAILALMRRIGLAPDAVVGHSTGEYSALIAAGAYQFDEDKLMEDMRVLNQHYQRVAAAGLITQGWLVAVAGASGEALETLLAQRDDLHLAMDNCPQQQVVCALSEASADWLEQQLATMSALSARLPFDRAYHTPAFRAFCDGLDQFFNRLQLQPPKTRLYSCVTAAPMPEDTGALQELAIVQWASRVRFRETVEQMYADGIGIFVECAPRNNLCAFVDDVLRNRPHLACPVDVEHRGGIEQFNHLIAQLAAEGVRLDLAGLYAEPPRAEAAATRPLMKLQAGLQPFALAARSTPTPAPSAAPVVVIEPARPNGAQPPVSETLVAAPPPREPELALPAIAAPAPAAEAAAAPVATMVGALDPPVADSVDPVLSAHFDTMDMFLRQQQQIMEAYLGGGDAVLLPQADDLPVPLPPVPVPADASMGSEPARMNGVDHVATLTEPPSLPRLSAALAAAPGGFPLLYRGEVGEADGQVVIRVGWDVREHLYLLDHTMGRAVSALDATLTALPVVPFTFSMEALAEAAAAATGRAVVAMREVRAHRWIALDDGHIDIELALPPLAEWAGDELRVTLRKARGPGDERAHPPFVEGTVVLGRVPPEAPLAAAQHYRRERPSRWRPEELYTEVMFHGPKLRAIAAMERWGEDGSECTLVGLPRKHLFSFTETPEFLTDPITTDAMGQLIGMWVSDEHEDGMHDFPFRLEQFDVFGATLLPGERTLCRARSELVGGEDVRNGFHRSDIEVVDAGGRLRFRMTGWWDMRFDMPERFHAARCHTDRIALARGMPEWLPPSSDGLAAASVDDITLDFLEPSGEFWLRALSQMMLNRTERDSFRAMNAVILRRAEWLLGRIAAKDAVRDLLRRRGAALVYPADIEIAAEEEGRPFVSAPWLAGRLPQISIAHKAGRAVALAGDGERFAGVGIDIETIEERSETFIEAAFAPGERALIAALPAAERALATTRIWCAKEAVGKALGLALAEILSRLEVQGCGEVVRVALASDDGGKFRTFDATTVCDGDFVIALVAIPADN